MSSIEPEEDIALLFESITPENVDLLYQRLGEFNPELPLGAAPHDSQTYIAAGRAWWTKHVPQIRSYVCCNEAIQTAAAKAGSNAAQAAFGILAAHFGGPLATYASVLFVKDVIGDAVDEGVMRNFKAWCADAWRSPRPQATQSAEPENQTDSQG
jgi:hypothetical protein